MIKIDHETTGNDGVNKCPMMIFILKMRACWVRDSSSLGCLVFHFEFALLKCTKEFTQVEHDVHISVYKS